MREAEAKTEPIRETSVAWAAHQVGQLVGFEGAARRGAHLLPPVAVARGHLDRFGLQVGGHLEHRHATLVVGRSVLGTGVRLGQHERGGPVHRPARLARRHEAGFVVEHLGGLAELLAATTPTRRQHDGKEDNT